MGTNIDLLRNGLNDYIGSLTMHNQMLNEDFKNLSEIFTSVNQAYEGHAAEAFKNSWLATAQWFQEYIRETTLLIRFLQERVAWLEQEK
ncbi:MAG: hypothetical protein KF862_15530 [Chitinophagaceae bacterium]|nr:hypothetical protein [Chitinophagaceae bacterium]